MFDKGQKQSSMLSCDSSYFTTTSHTISLKTSNVTYKSLTVILRNMNWLPAIFSYISHYISRFDVSVDKPSVS